MKKDECGLDLLGADDSSVGGIDLSSYAPLIKSTAESVAQQQQRQTYVTPFTAAASGATLAHRGCMATGMTIWHWIFFVLIFAALFFVPRAIAYLKWYYFVTPSEDVKFNDEFEEFKGEVQK